MKVFKRYSVLVSSLLSIFTFILLASGFVLAVSDLLRPAGSKTAPKSAPRLATARDGGGMLIGLGDSLTRGIGDPEGQGYFGLVKERLMKNHSGSFSAVNLAVSGQTSTDLIRQVREKRVQSLVKNADRIVMTIGGNDLFRSSGRLAKIDEKSAEEARRRYRENLSAILSELRKANPHATIYLFGLYNPFGDMAEARRSSRLVAEWNETMQSVAAEHDRVVIVPTFDLFQLSPRKYLYNDHFHPNRTGYERMADRLLQVIGDQPGEVQSAYGR
jgi:lysophospholipase L1-like esterase